MSTSDCADVVALRLTAERYARGADRRSKDDWRAVLADEVEIAGPGFKLRGLETVLGSIDLLSRQFKATRHTIHNQVAEIDGDTATGETYGTAEHRMPNPAGEGEVVLCWAIRYQDQWQRVAGTWKFTRRELIVDWEEMRPVHDVGAAT